ncbi:MAG TPA: glycosyltransferase family 9 protein [Verrucomicrobiae bacterium]|nr:glycosyltransferase family 9 protein [Verrucomicrobiae bacterium]
MVTRLKSIGDILFTLPALHVLRENFPHLKITFLTSKEFAPVLEGFRDVDEILTIDRSLFRRGNLVHIAQESWSLMALLRQRKFSLVVDFQGYGETALITWLTRAPQRWGTVYQSSRGYAYTHGVRRTPQIHPAADNLLLLQQCGLNVRSARNEFVVPEDAMAEARRLFRRCGLDSSRLSLFIQPFTSSAQKNWPLEKYLALANYWRDAGALVLFGGGPREKAWLDPVVLAGFPISAGAPLLVSAGLTQLCNVTIGGDTGLLHMAVAMDKRVVMIGAPHRYPSRFYPFQHPEWKLMPPDGCDISAVTVQSVVKACEDAFADCACNLAPALAV